MRVVDNVVVDREIIISGKPKGVMLPPVVARGCMNVHIRNRQVLDFAVVAGAH